MFAPRSRISMASLDLHMLRRVRVMASMLSRCLVKNLATKTSLLSVSFFAGFTSTVCVSFMLRDKLAQWPIILSMEEKEIAYK